MLLNIGAVVTRRKIKPGVFYRASGGLTLLGMPLDPGKTQAPVLVINVNKPDLQFAVTQPTGSESLIELPKLQLWLDTNSATADAGKNGKLSPLAVAGEKLIVNAWYDSSEIYIDFATGETVEAPNDPLYFPHWKLIFDNGRAYEMIIEMGA